MSLHIFLLLLTRAKWGGGRIDSEREGDSSIIIIAVHYYL